MCRLAEPRYIDPAGWLLPYKSADIPLFIASNTTIILPPRDPEMVLHKGTKFTVRQYEDDVPYVEHTDDAEVDNSTGAPSLYIEAVSGQRFYIDVEIDDSFDFASSPSIEIACYVDGAEVFLKYLHAKDVARGGGIQGLETRRICCTTTDRFLDGRWMRCSLLFKDIKPGT